MDVNTLISDYGYWAVLIGCLAEGETFALLGGAAAHEGLLHYGWVLGITAVGGILGDTALFFLGRYYGSALLARFKKHEAKISSANRLIRKHPVLFVIGVRFMYGLRIIGPIIIGASRLSPATFMALNVIGALLWATLFVSLGYLGGQVISPWLHSLTHPTRYLLLVLVVLALVWGIRSALRHRRAKQE